MIYIICQVLDSILNILRIHKAQLLVKVLLYIFPPSSPALYVYSLFYKSHPCPFFQEASVTQTYIDNIRPAVGLVLVIQNLISAFLGHSTSTIKSRGTDTYSNPVLFYLTQFSSVAQSCSTLCDTMNRSTPGLPVHHQLPEFAQTHFH